MHFTWVLLFNRHHLGRQVGIKSSPFYRWANSGLKWCICPKSQHKEFPEAFEQENYLTSTLVCRSQHLIQSSGWPHEAVTIIPVHRRGEGTEGPLVDGRAGIDTQVFSLQNPELCHISELPAGLHVLLKWGFVDGKCPFKGTRHQERRATNTLSRIGPFWTVSTTKKSGELGDVSSDMWSTLHEVLYLWSPLILQLEF